MDELLRATGICKHYVLGDTHIEVLKGVDLGVVRGEIVAVVGGFGCWKEYFVAHHGRVRPSDFGNGRHRWRRYICPFRYRSRQISQPPDWVCFSISPPVTRFYRA